MATSVKEKNRAYRQNPANAEKIKAAREAWRADPANKGSIARHARKNYETHRAARSAQNKAWRASVEGTRWECARGLKKYGLTAEDYARLLEAQGHKCAICRLKLDTGKNTHVDHCHTTGRVRGLLCQPCNLAIGLLSDSAAVALSAAAYLGQS